MTDQDTPRLLTVTQAAALTGWSRMRVLRGLSSGKLRGRKLGGAGWVILAADLPGNSKEHSA